MFSIICAVDINNGIAKDGIIPWIEPKDMAFFRKITTYTNNPWMQNAVIMGRKTWETLNKPLPNRLNIIISSSAIKLEEENLLYSKVIVFKSLDASLSYLSIRKDIEKIFVIGGAMLYNEAIKHEKCKYIYLTVIPYNYNCDLLFPNVDENIYTKVNIIDSGNLVFNTYERITNKEEQQYLNLIKEIMDKGIYRVDRTLTGTLSLFGKHMRFNLSKSFPLLTTKKVFWRGVCEELLWFISGSPNSNNLKDKGVNIWVENTSRKFLNSRGLNEYEEGSIGKGYGFQWRHWGAEYTTMNADYTGKGKDQLSNIINMIKTNPFSRKIIMTAWNPADLHLMALEPCHILSQFYVAEGKLSCTLYQRSCDMGLGIPFNIASYALLTCMIAKICDLLPGEFIHMMGDTHVYLTHIEGLKKQLERNPRPFPKLLLDKVNSIDDYKMNHIHLIEYDPYPTIKLKMAV